MKLGTTWRLEPFKVGSDNVLLNRTPSELSASDGVFSLPL